MPNEISVTATTPASITLSERQTRMIAEAPGQGTMPDASAMPKSSFPVTSPDPPSC